MTFTEVEILLAERLGFDVHSVGRKAVESAIRQSMKQAGGSDPAAYARALANDPVAWDRLVEKVVIPETWFFRDVVPFQFATEFVRTHLRRASRALRILSCPCSTGEEPYSLVMAMLHGHIPAESFHVDAVDVNPRAIKSAQAAVFNERSFRDDALPYRAKYFEPEGGSSWRLKNNVVSLVQFWNGNLISPDFLAGAEPYDLIFCRNLLIYLHPEAQSLAMTTLRRLMARDAVLVLGHAEAAFARQHGFRPAGSPAAFAFVDRGLRNAAKSHQKAHRSAPTKHEGHRHAPPMHFPLRPAATEAKPPVPVEAVHITPRLRQQSEPSLLVVARRLGDSGKLHDAVEVCGEHLRLVPDSVEGYFLLGVLYDALGHAELAVKSFRKALYLDPTHREALLHLALKHEARGEEHAAALLRERARRSPSQSLNE